MGAAEEPCRQRGAWAEAKMRPVIRVLYLPGWRLTHAEPRASLREDKLGSEVDAYCTHQRPL